MLYSLIFEKTAFQPPLNVKEFGLGIQVRTNSTLIVLVSPPPRSHPYKFEYTLRTQYTANLAQCPPKSIYTHTQNTQAPFTYAHCQSWALGAMKR